MGSKYGRKGNKVWMLVRGVQTTTNVIHSDLYLVEFHVINIRYKLRYKYCEKMQTNAFLLL